MYQLKAKIAKRASCSKLFVHPLIVLTAKLCSNSFKHLAHLGTCILDLNLSIIM